MQGDEVGPQVFAAARQVGSVRKIIGKYAGLSVKAGEVFAQRHPVNHLGQLELMGGIVAEPINYRPKKFSSSPMPSST